MLAGETTSSDVIAREVLREAIIRKSNFLATGTNLIPTRNLAVLDVKFQYPSEMVGEYPVPETSIAGREKITWSDYNMTLEQGEVTFMLTDQAVLRQLDNLQLTTSVRKAQEAMARQKDKEILDAIIAGAYSGNDVTVTAGDEWNGGGTGADPESDIVDAWNNIVANSTVFIQEMVNVNLLVPANVIGELYKLKLIGNVQQKLSEYVKGSFNINIWPTRYTDSITHDTGSFYDGLTGISDDAYLIVYSEDTGIHGVLQTNQIPMSEQRRVPLRGEEYFFRSFFRTKISPKSSSESTSAMIAKIANVC